MAVRAELKNYMCESLEQSGFMAQLILNPFTQAEGEALQMCCISEHSPKCDRLLQKVWHKYQAGIAARNFANKMIDCNHEPWPDQVGVDFSAASDLQYASAAAPIVMQGLEICLQNPLCRNVSIAALLLAGAFLLNANPNRPIPFQIKEDLADAQNRPWLDQKDFFQPKPPQRPPMSKEEAIALAAAVSQYFFPNDIDVVQAEMLAARTPRGKQIKRPDVSSEVDKVADICDQLLIANDEAAYIEKIRMLFQLLKIIFQQQGRNICPEGKELRTAFQALDCTDLWNSNKELFEKEIYPDLLLALQGDRAALERLASFQRNLLRYFDDNFCEEGQQARDNFLQELARTLREQKGS